MTNKGLLHIDISKDTALIICRACPGWSALRLNRLDAWEAGRQHEANVHPGSSQAASNITAYQKYQAKTNERREANSC